MFKRGTRSHCGETCRDALSVRQHLLCVAVPGQYSCGVALSDDKQRNFRIYSSGSIPERCATTPSPVRQASRSFAVWSASANGSAVVNVSEKGKSYREHVLQWTALRVATRRAPCGSQTELPPGELTADDRSGIPNCCQPLRQGDHRTSSRGNLSCNVAWGLEACDGN